MTCGTIAIGDFQVSRLGFGTMRIVGDGVIGPPRDVAAARETLRLVPELGVNLVDTANSYGPLIAELLVRAVLHPYRGLVVATKGGFLRPGPFQWKTDGRPEALRAAVEGSLVTLGVDCIDLWQLHRIDPATIRADFQRAGFVLEGESDLLRNPADDHTTVAELASRSGSLEQAFFELTTGSVEYAGAHIQRGIS